MGTPEKRIARLRELYEEGELSRHPHIPWLLDRAERVAALETALCAAQSDMEWCRDHSRDAHEHDEMIERVAAVLNPSDVPAARP
jgi:hypothetical protein